MSDNEKAKAFAESFIVKTIGQEWVIPTSIRYSGSEDVMHIYSSNVAIKTNQGWLLLARTERICSGPNTGQIRRVLVKPEELNTEESK